MYARLAGHANNDTHGLELDPDSSVKLVYSSSQQPLRIIMPQANQVMSSVLTVVVKLCHVVLHLSAVTAAEVTSPCLCLPPSSPFDPLFL
jgi:hypothetical protein